MDKGLEDYLKFRTKQLTYGGYEFSIEGVKFNIIETPLFIGVQYFYSTKTSISEILELKLDKNISLQDFAKKIVSIVEEIDKAYT